MDTIYDTLAKLNKVANAPEIVKEDNQAMMKKGLEDLMKKTRFNKDADYKPFGKGDKDYETGLPKDAKKDKMFDDMAAADAAKMNKQKNYTPFSDKQSPDGLPEKKKDDKMFEGPGGQSKHELIRQLFKTHFGQPQYNELTGGRSGMRRLKVITGTSRPGYTAQPVDTSDFEREIEKAGLSGDVRVKSDKDGYAVTVLYPDAFRQQSIEEADVQEAVGTAADPIMDLCDEVGCDPDHPIFKEIVRYMSGDQIKDFVDDYRRHHEMNASFESDEVEATEESDEAVEETEKDVQETVEVAVDDLAKLMALAGQQADTQAQANELEEYSNSPDEDYMDADMQLNKLSGGLNGPKAQHKKEYPGDNPLAAKLADQLKDLMSK